MTRTILLALQALAIVLAGLSACRPVASVVSQLQPPAASQPEVRPAVQALGTIEIVVHWPERDVRDFKAQLIPTSTTRIDFEARTVAGAVAGTASVTRSEPAATEATASMTLEAGTYDFSAKAFRNETEIARASPARAQIVAGALVSADLTLGPLFQPVITGFSPRLGVAGTTVTISGENLKPDGVATPVVRFNGVAAAVTAGSATSLTVTVPAGVTSGTIEVLSDGMAVMSTGTFLAMAPRLNAIYPAVAAVGAKIRLEGVFDPSTTVNFPGGVTAAATVQGLNRAEVTVPTGATAGTLTVTIGGVAVPGVAFRATTFSPGLGDNLWHRYTSQSTGRPMPKLVTARYGHCSAVIGRYLYVVTGRDTLIERAAISADGNLGPFQIVGGSVLAQGRYMPGCAVIRNYLYVYGGKTDSGTTNSIERAAIDANGDLGAFETTAGTLAVPRDGQSSAVIGNYLYVIGGRNGTNYTGSIERAAIDADGSLGAFQAIGSLSLQVARIGAGSAVIGKYLYVFGGSRTGQNGITNVERAAIDGDGNLGSFETVAGVSLGSRRGAAASAVVGDSLYVIGGIYEDATATELASVERATFDADGNLGAFSTVPGMAMTRTRYNFDTVVVGNYVYAIGGATNCCAQDNLERISIENGDLGTFRADSSSLAVGRTGIGIAVIRDAVYALGGNVSGGGCSKSVERANLDSDGNLGSFLPVDGVQFATSRTHFGTALVGSYLYVLGGDDCSAYLNTVERASIDLNGNLGTFQPVSGVTFATARNRFGNAIIGNYLYVIGGYSGGGESGFRDSVERAALDSSGNLGQFQTVTGVTLATRRIDFTSQVIGNWLYVFGGDLANGSHPASIERAAIDSSGNLGTFAAVSGVNLATPREFPRSATIGNRVYVFGGAGAGGRLSSIERASIDASGNLGAFQVIVGMTLTTPRNQFASFLLGNGLFVLGGSDYLATVEKALLQ